MASETKPEGPKPRRHWICVLTLRRDDYERLPPLHPFAAKLTCRGCGWWRFR